MTSEQTRNDRLRFPESVREVYDALTNGTDPQQTPFEYLKDVFIISACIGFNKGLNKSIAGPKGGDFRLEVFSETDKDILKAIAVAHSGDVLILERRGDEVISAKVLDLVEEFAHGGALELKALLLDKPGTTLWNLVDLIKSIK